MVAASIVFYIILIFFLFRNKSINQNIPDTKKIIGKQEFCFEKRDSPEAIAMDVMWHKLWVVGLHYLLPYLALDDRHLDEREVWESAEDKENKKGDFHVLYISIFT